MRENDDQLDIIHSIKAAGGYAKKWATPYSVGVADLVCSLPGIGIFLMEVKMFGNKLEPKQEYEKEQFEKAGGLVVVCYVRRKVSLNFPITKLCFWDSKKKVYEGILDPIQVLATMQKSQRITKQQKLPSFMVK